jgi:hypothetical protein
VKEYAIANEEIGIAITAALAIVLVKIKLHVANQDETILV